MASPVDLIKERLSIVDVVGTYIKLEKAGSNLKAKCPFHNEKTPSFFVSPSRGSFYCFGCGAKGDIFTFVQEFEGVDFPGALKILASRANVTLVRENPKEKSERDRLFELMDCAVHFYEMTIGNHKEVSEYLASRGLVSETISSWRIGFAEDDWRRLHDHCLSKGFSVGELEKAGLIKKTDEGRYYDRFRSRIMFPIFDSSGRVVAFSGRIFGKESADAPKYLNSPETSLFSKSKILYGFDRAKNEIRRLDYAILVEGQVDLVMSHQAGTKNAIATSGTALTSDQLEILRRLSRRLLLVYDADKAGVGASLKSAVLALSEGFDVKVAGLPKGLDPADMIHKDQGLWKECLRNGKHVVDFYLDIILEDNLEPRKLALTIRDKLLPYVAVIGSSIEKTHFVTKISSKTGIKEQAIYDDLKKINSPTVVGEDNSTSLGSGTKGIESLLLGVIFWQSRLKEPIIESRDLSARLEIVVGKDNFERLFFEANKDLETFIFQAESYYDGWAGPELLKELDELLLNLEEDAIKSELGFAITGLASAEKAGDKARVRELLEKSHSLGSRLTAIRKSRGG